MTVLASNIFNVTVNGTGSVLVRLPELSYSALTPGSVVGFVAGQYKEGNGTVLREFATLEGGFLANTPTVTITPDLVGLNLVVREVPFNVNGYPIRMYASAPALIVAQEDPRGEWAFGADSTLLSFPRPQRFQLTFSDDTLVSVEQVA